MPIEKRTNYEGDLVDRYVVPFGVRTGEFTDEHVNAVRAHRREYAGINAALSDLQKKFAAEKDFQVAKALKDDIKYAIQCEKAATLVINWFEKATTTSTLDFPLELYNLLDFEFNAVELARDRNDV